MGKDSGLHHGLPQMPSVFGDQVGVFSSLFQQYLCSTVQTLCLCACVFDAFCIYADRQDDSTAAGMDYLVPADCASGIFQTFSVKETAYFIT